MNFREREVKLAYIREAILCIAFGSGVGLLTYSFFLYFNIAIFGWNLGLIFAPLFAGYCETVLAQKIIGEDIGAISAFILFIYTTFYSFILKNPTLGINFITFGATAVILQAAFPILINYIILVVIFGILSYLAGIFKRITHYFYINLKIIYYKYIKKQPQRITLKTRTLFDENESNELINSQNFYYITSTDILDKNIINLGQFHTTVVVEKNKHLIKPNPLKIEKEELTKLKIAKDKCLIQLADEIKKAGGNGVVDLKIDYGLVGLGGDLFKISAMGMGVFLK